MDGASLFTERVKSSIRFLLPTILEWEARLILAAALGTGKEVRFFNHRKISHALKRRKGKNGTAKIPISRNHKLYCIRLDKLFLKIRFMSRRMPMMPQISTLQIRKRTIKSAIFFSSFFRFLRKKSAERIQL